MSEISLPEPSGHLSCRSCHPRRGTSLRRNGHHRRLHYLGAQGRLTAPVAPGHRQRPAGTRTAFRGGWATAALGLAIHFLIAFTAAAVFYAASRRIAALLHHPWFAGVGYALVVYGFMYWVVMPLSRLRRGR